uniref:Uncharacterized protein n=1 Tax=Ascaris lumbricoides TaxID=6252 RepID=A0A0M3HZ61_ASCLU
MERGGILFLTKSGNENDDNNFVAFLLDPTGFVGWTRRASQHVICRRRLEEMGTVDVVLATNLTLFGIF